MLVELNNRVTTTTNNNPFNSPLSMSTRVSQYQKNIYSITPCLCSYYTTSSINFLHFLWSTASSLGHHLSGKPENAIKSPGNVRYKSCQRKLFIANFTFWAISVFSWRLTTALNRLNMTFIMYW